MTEVFRTMRDVLGFRLFEIGDTPVTVATLITVLAILIATVVTSSLLRKALTKMLRRARAGERSVGTVTGLLHYLLLVVGFGIAIQTVGIDLSALFAAGALFAVAIGFAMQSIIQNFVAGVILLSERTINPGDILMVEGKMVKVTDMGIRSITAETRDGENLIIPNSVLIQTTVTNYTLANSALRIRVPVGVVYGSDMTVVRETLESVARRVTEEWHSSDRRPQVVMTEFGNNSVNWQIAVWMDDPWDYVPHLSHLYESVWRAFKEKNIVIAFPQLDLHLDEPVVEGLRALRPGAA